MKRTLIRSTIMVLAVLAVSVSIKAQSSQQYTADIPFDFEARGERHAAGKYRLGSVSVTSPGTIALREMQSGQVKVLGIANDFPTMKSWDNPGTLSFRKVNGRYLLSEISTVTFRLKMRRAKGVIRGAGDIAAVESIVKINLN